MFSGGSAVKSIGNPIHGVGQVKARKGHMPNASKRGKTDASTEI